MIFLPDDVVHFPQVAELMVMNPLKLIPVLLYGSGNLEQYKFCFRNTGLDLLFDLMPDLMLLDFKIQIVTGRLEQHQQKE